MIARSIALGLLLAACASVSAPVHDDGMRERAAAFLDANMPERDRGVLSKEFLEENLDLALATRAEFLWSKSVPEELFLNDVLPYAVFDESRDPWRRELHDLCKPIVAGAKSASDAAQALNRELFKQISLHYNTARERPNQSFVESKKSGKASCTGLSIALVDACRSVGIPARAVGTPSWTKKEGNHTWVEIWDGDWHFAGADEYDAGGLDRGWFVGDAGDARADQPEHAIYATSWKREGVHFPLAWSRRDESVAAIDVTARYAKQPSAPAPDDGTVFLRIFDRRGGDRIAAELELVHRGTGEPERATSRAGASDLNDMPRFEIPKGEVRGLKVTREGATRWFVLSGLGAGPATIELFWDELPAWNPGEMSTAASEMRSAGERIAQEFRAKLRTERAAEMESQSIAIGDKTLRWLEKSFGDAGEGHRSLWISMHGGGGAPSEVNDQQWQNQIKLYQPEEGIYVAPRAPTDNWNLWHEAHIDPMFSRMIEDFVALRGVDPDRVYLMGYSAGGDGVWQLAPRMADRFAAAAMMAGHPNEASLLGLRNLPFAIFMGGDDKAYDRNKVAQDRAAQLDELQKADPTGYEHFVRIYEGLGHWMQKKDAEALPWMARHRRNAWPKKVVWFQDDVVHERFYWLGRAPGKAHVGEKIVAEVDGQTIRITAGNVKDVQLWLSPALLDIEKPVVVEVDGKKVFEGSVGGFSEAVWQESLEQRYDPVLSACAKLDLSW